MIYTRTGDRLETSAIGGQRVGKNAPIINFYGEIDSLNAMLGLAASIAGSSSIAKRIEREQRNLFVVPLLVGCPNAAANEATSRHAAALREATLRLEQEIDRAAQNLQPVADFILPGGSVAAAVVGLARTQCRKAERALSSLKPTCRIADECAAYINRLSDWLYTASRVLNKISNTEEKKLHNCCG